MKNKIRMQLPTILAVLLTIGILVWSFLWFSRHTDEMIASTTEFYLETNARSQAAAFNTKLNNQIDLMEHLAKQFKDTDMNNDAAIIAKLKQLEGIEDFQTIAVAGKSGRLADNKGNQMGDVSKTEYYKMAFEGKATISDSVLHDRKNGDFLYIAVPILQDDEPKGVVYGQFPLTVLRNLIEAVGFQETSTSLLLSRNGTIIARSATNELVTDRIANFYDLGSSWGINGETSLKDIKIDVLNAKTMTIPYRTGSRERLAVLTPVGFNNWYYAIVIPQDVIKKQSNTLSYNMLFVEGMITLAFVFLFVTILHLIRSMALVEQSNERFKMVTRQAHTVVFDYDFNKEEIVLNGSVQYIDSDAEEKYSLSELLKKAKDIIHENDVSVVSDIKKAIKSGEGNLNHEMRILCADGHYYWFRCTGTIVRNEKGEPLRLVGNFMDVEDEVTKQEKLKQKAEIDPLSGLLNKGAFTSYVKNLLAQSNEKENLYAFYIIDLDNFKKVNDTLGHMVGDKVITDVAKKICTVFSENDYVGRIGGDEFTAFLKLSGEGVQVGQKIIEAKAKALCAIINEIYSDGKNEVNITSSIGVAIYPKNGVTFEELYKNADSVLYVSKNNGKNQYNICK
ncbi:MAG: diguanylate cyclase [Selenomonadaceae bacterium]|nr:diguanylate cyclase [Selenomonadaceae bacterium]